MRRRTVPLALVVSLLAVPMLAQDLTSSVPPRDWKFSRAAGSAAEVPQTLRRLAERSASGARFVIGDLDSGVIAADLDIPVTTAAPEAAARAFLAEHLASIAPALAIAELEVVPPEESCEEAPGSPDGKRGTAVTFRRVVNGAPVIGGLLTVHVSAAGTIDRVQNTIPSVPPRVSSWGKARQGGKVDAAAFVQAKRPRLDKFVSSAKARDRMVRQSRRVLVPVKTRLYSGLVEARQVFFPMGGRPATALLLSDGTLLTPVVLGGSDSAPVSGVHLDEYTKLPTFVSFRPNGLTPSAAGVVANPAELAFRFLEENPDWFHTGKARCQFFISDVHKDASAPRVTFVKLQQQIAGRRVFGGELVFEIQDGSKIMTIQGHTLGRADMPLAPAVTRQQALATAKQQLTAQVAASPQATRDAVAALPWQSELLIFGGALFPRKGSGPLPSRLAWMTQNAYQVWFIDAVTGMPLYAYSRSMGANVVRDGLGLNHLGRPLYVTVNVNGIPGPGTPSAGDTDVATAVAAVAGTAAFYAAHGWTGQNGTSAASDFVANTNVSFAYPFVGNLCPNAVFLAGLDEAFFCNGTPATATTPAVSGTAVSDVVAHELTHGVVAHSSALVYADEPGALNESYADIMGNLVFPDAIPAGSPAGTLPGWLEGETALGGPFRNMAAPGVATYSAYLSRTDLGCSLLDLPGLVPPCDFGGVHTNSGINNRAHVILSDGGVGAITGMGRGRLRLVAFNTFTSRLVSSSRMIDAALATRAACDMFVATGGSTFDTPPLPFRQIDCDQVQPSFSAVGLDPDLVSGWLPPTLGFGGTIARFPAETTDNGCTVTDVTLQMSTASGLLDASATTAPGGVPTINYFGLQTATIPITTPPIGTTAKTHTIAWTSIFGSTPQISSSLAAPAPAGTNNCVSPAGALPVDRASGTASASFIPFLGGTGTTTTGNAASSMALPCGLRRTEVELMDGGSVIAGPGPTATHTTTYYVFGVPVTMTQTATVSAQPAGLVGAANPGAWNLSAPVAWSVSPGLAGMSWRLRYYLDQPATVTCNP